MMTWIFAAFILFVTAATAFPQVSQIFTNADVPQQCVCFEPREEMYSQEEEEDEEIARELEVDEPLPEFIPDPYHHQEF